jgi:Nucleoside-diphosphate-sugar epimerases
MEMKSFFKNRKILVTGHTGFIGSWLTKWLTMLNSEVCGYALKPPSKPNLYEILDIKHNVTDVRGDIRDKYLLKKQFKSFGLKLCSILLPSQ